MKAYKLRIEFVWGHQSRIIGLSKTNPSYYYPPPTTILGAVAEPIAKEYKLGENPTTTRRLLSTISKNLLAIGLRPVNTIPVKYMDINKIIAVRVRKEKYPSPRDLPGSFDAPARGKTIMVPLDGNPPSIEVILVFEEENMFFEGRSIRIAPDLLWEIHRLGSKESKVSVTDLEESTDIDVEEGIATTRYSLPLLDGVEVIEKIRGRWAYEAYVNPYMLGSDKPLLQQYLSGIQLTTYMVPIKTAPDENPSIKVRVREPAAIYSVRFGGSRERVVGVAKPNA